jgi:protein-S-isoprenylcysteine O-methyltransferase Ste14
MNDLNTKAFGGLLNLLICMASLIFLPAWTLKYWQAWVFLFAFFVPALAITLYLMKKDPKLLERRVKGGAAAEKETSQKIIQGFAALAFGATIVFPALDHRFKLSIAPAWAVLGGDALVLLGFFAVFLVFKENTFTSGIIEVSAEQRVISTGPYALVRHPMYLGALVLLLGVPLALGSWWGLLTMIPMTFVLVVRILFEERFLGKNLPGYSEYRNLVRYRLVPLIW